MSLARDWAKMSEGRDFEDSNSRREFWSELVRKSEARVIVEKALLAENSALEIYLAQSFCM